MNEEMFKQIEKVIKSDKSLLKIRNMIKKAIDSCPKNVSFEDAKKQVETFYKW